MSVEQRWDFKFSLPEQPGGKLVELSFAEIEELLVNKLREAKGDKKDALWQWGAFAGATSGAGVLPESSG